MTQLCLSRVGIYLITSKMTISAIYSWTQKEGWAFTNYYTNLLKYKYNNQLVNLTIKWNFKEKNSNISAACCIWSFSFGTGQSFQSFENSYAKEAAGDYQGAINDLVGLNGFDYHKSLRLGWLYYLSKNFDISIYYYQQAVKLRPKAVEALLGLCNPLEALSKIDQLEATYKKILAIDPMNSKINYALGNIYYYQKKFHFGRKTLRFGD